MQWDARFGGSEIDYFGSLQQTSDGRYILGGSSNSGINGDKTQASQGGYDFWVVKLLLEATEPCSVAPTDLYADPILPTKVKLNWSADPGAIKYQVRYRITGTPTWSTTVATSNFKNLNSLEPATEYQYRVRSYCGPGTFSGWSAIATFMTPPLRLGDFTTNQAFTIYPNPNTGSFHLQMEGENNEQIYIRIINVLGQEIYTETIQSETEINYNIQLNQSIENGMYLLEVKTSDKIYTEQIIISR